MKIVTKEIGKTFSQRVVEYALMVPKGKVTTYGHIARAAGGGGQAARSVNAILVKAYHSGETRIPFHRIVYAGGKIWKNNSTSVSRAVTYKKEGILVNKKGVIENYADIVFEFL